MDTDRKEERGREEASRLSVPPPSKENGKKIATTAAPFYPDILFIGRVESPPVSTGAETFGDIMRPENGIRSNLFRGTRSRR
jgi:hypothetical protein